MIKKNSLFKWGQLEYEAFKLIKPAIFNAPSLATPNFSDPFILYTFASEKSYAAILTQANQDKAEAPIAFFSSNLQGAKLNYSDVEKQAYAIFKAIKHFRPFLLKTHTKIIVPFPAVRNLLVQKDVGEKRANWVTALHEYDAEIKPTNIVKGQGFCKMLVGASLISEIPSPNQEVQMYEVSLNDIDSRYVDIIFYLKNGYAPSNLNYTKKRILRLKAKQYQLVNDVLFKMNYDYVLLRCLEKSEAEKVLQELHDGPTGEIIPRSSKQHRYILTTTDYFTKWIEAVPLNTTNAEHIIDFIDQFIIIRFGLPSALMFDNASYFSGNSMTEFALKRGFKLKYSTTYYPQGNGLVKSMNKNLIKIIKRTIDQNHKNWHKSLMYALWVDRITKKSSIGTSPFNLVYGKEVVLPTHLTIPSLALVQFIDETPTSSLQLKKLQIFKLEEQREQAKITHAHHQALVKASFNSNMVSKNDFQIGDLILKWDKTHEEKGKHSKFQRMWFGPFQIAEIIGPSNFMLQISSEKRIFTC
eukprot:PITA_22666